jgi:hypothetical protein
LGENISRRQSKRNVHQRDFQHENARILTPNLKQGEIFQDPGDKCHRVTPAGENIEFHFRNFIRCESSRQDSEAQTISTDLSITCVRNIGCPQISKNKKLFLGVINPPEAFSAPQNAQFCS